MGRKAFQFTPEVIEQVERMAGLGLTKERMAGVLGIHHTTFSKNQRDNDKINLAIERGKGKASFTVGRALFEEAKMGNVPAIKWWEQTRDNRAERTENNNKNETEVKVTITPHDG